MALGLRPPGVHVAVFGLPSPSEAKAQEIQAQDRHS